MRFEVGQLAILNNEVVKGLPNRVGEVVEIVNSYSSPNYDYMVELDTGDFVPVRDRELNEVTEEQLQLMTYIKRGNKAIYAPLNEEVTILKCDFLHGKIEVRTTDNAMIVVGIETLKPIGYMEEDLLLDEEKYQETINGHTKEYWIDLFFGHYDNGDSTYTVPKDLLHNLLEKLI